MNNKYSSRISKYRKHREKIDSNENIYLSIVNSDEKLLNLFESINFNIELAYEKSGFTPVTNETKNTRTTNETKEIEVILDEIEQNSIQSKLNNANNEINDFNSHRNDQTIKEYFIEFMDKKELQAEEEQETTSLKIKINKVNMD